MKLDRSTYEAWLLDRIEGRLSLEQERELSAFLLAHPELDADAGDLPSVDAGTNSFAGKDLLKHELPPQGAITSFNLTDFLIARLEGDLDAAQLQALERFMGEHPELARESKLVQATRTQREAIIFPARAALHRTIPPTGAIAPHTLTDFLIAASEGDLTRDQRAALDAYLLAHPETARQAAMVQRLRIPAERIEFPDKAALKKKEGRVIPLWSAQRTMVRLAAAASIALLLGLGWWALRRGPAPEEQLAHEQVERTSGGPATMPAGIDTASGSRATVGNDPINGSSSDHPEAEQREPGTSPERQQDRQDPRIKRRSQGVEQLEPRLAQQRGPGTATPISAEVQDVPVSAEQENDLAANEPVLAPPQAYTVGELLTHTVRENVLQAQRPASEPLGREDAVALVDRGLEAVSEGKAGLDVQRGERGRWSHVKLRLGKDLAFTASR